jgi:hypothetical protein
MTSTELFEKIKPSNQTIYIAQYNSRGLDFNQSDLFSRLIKDAARCNGYNSDIYYDLCYIDDFMKHFEPAAGNEPIWLGFRKLGVDCTSFVLCRCENDFIYGSLAKNYFALYSISIEPDENGWYRVVLNEYPV